MRKCSHRQTVFATEYLKTWSVTEAARRAGYAPSHNGHRLLKNPAVKAMIDEALKRTEMERAEAMVRLTRIARFDLSQYILPDGTVDLPKLLASEDACVIKRIKATRYGPEIELHDKLAALDRIGKALGLFGDKVEVNATMNGTLEIAPVDYRTALEPLAPSA